MNLTPDEKSVLCVLRETGEARVCYADVLGSVGGARRIYMRTNRLANALESLCKNGMVVMTSCYPTGIHVIEVGATLEDQR